MAPRSDMTLTSSMSDTHRHSTTKELRVCKSAGPRLKPNGPKAAPGQVLLSSGCMKV